MRFTLKQGTKLLLGGVAVELLEAAAVDFPNAANMDSLAGELAQNQAAFAEHREELSHTETVVRTIDGETREVTVDVAYGAGGVRIETVAESEPAAIEESEAEDAPAAIEESEAGEAK